MSDIDKILPQITELSIDEEKWEKSKAFGVKGSDNIRIYGWNFTNTQDVPKDWKKLEVVTNNLDVKDEIKENESNNKKSYEDKLKDAILSGLAQIALDLSDIAEMVKSEIGTVIHKNDGQNEYTIKSRIKKLEKEIQVLSQIVNEADDNQVYIDKIKKCENELERLNSKLIECSKCEMNDIEAFINENEVNMLDYFDAVVRNTVESVLIISQNKIKIKYVGGIKITKSI